MLSDTLRYELAPLNVRVITLVVGNVTSYMASGVNGAPPTELPATSRYKAVEKEISTHQEMPGMSTAKFAEKVVDAVVAGKSGKVWLGGDVGIVRWLAPIMPGFIYVSTSCHVVGLV